MSAVTGSAQQNSPHLGYVYPAGGQRGTTFEVKVGGQFLANASAVLISGGDIQARVAGYDRPLNAQQVNALRERAEELRKKTRDATVTRELASIRDQLEANRQRLSNPVLSESATLQITVAQNAETGVRELKLLTPQGLSNPLVFCVGSLPEFSEAEPPAQGAPQTEAPQPELQISLPATVNGRIIPQRVNRQGAQVRPGQQFTPGDADRFRFRARKGQSLVITVDARRLIPYLADAVPGWFQATLALFDPAGNEIAYDDDFRFQPDPALHCVIPQDGDYVLEIKDALYRGRQDFVYRITLGELPFVTGIFPLGGRAGTPTVVTLQGWNLPKPTVTIEKRAQEAGISPVSVQSGEVVSNEVPFMTDTLPEGSDKEPNNDPSHAQRVNLPAMLNGRVDAPGDWDVFQLEGHAGDQIVAEVYARRLDSPLDSVLRLTDSAGKQLAFNDDHEDKGFGLNTHHADSLIMATLPAAGTYYLYLGDTQQRGGPEYGYRLRIGPPRPDFDLRVTPSSINAAGGMTVPVTVYALRRDGFAGDILLSLKNAPRGMILSGGLLPGGQERVSVTLTVPPAVLPQPISLQLEGVATIRGQEVRRAAVPAEDMMQAFVYRHLVTARDLKLAVPRRSPLRAPQAVLEPGPLQIRPGGIVRIPLRVPPAAANMLEKIDYELSEPPEGITLSTVDGGGALELFCDAAKVQPGLRGNLIVQVSGERPAPPGATPRPAANRRRIPLGALPAIPFEVIGKEPGNSGMRR